MSSRNMCLLPRATLHSDSEQLRDFWQRMVCGKVFSTERIVYFLNTVHCYNTLEEYYYEIQIHKALCDFTVETGYCWLKESLPPRHIRE